MRVVCTFRTSGWGWLIMAVCLTALTLSFVALYVWFTNVAGLVKWAASFQLQVSWMSDNSIFFPPARKRLHTLVSVLLPLHCCVDVSRRGAIYIRQVRNGVHPPLAMTQISGSLDTYAGDAPAGAQ